MTTMPADNSIIEITFVSKRREHPPITRLMFDITLHNPFDSQRWFLLPSSLMQESGGIKKDGIYGLQVFELEGEGRVILGRFLGATGFQALLLPADAELKMRRFPIQFYGELPPEMISIDLVIARQLQINGEPAAAWFGLDPSSDGQADVSAEQRRRLGSRNTPNLEAVPISIDEDSSLTLLVRLGDEIE